MPDETPYHAEMRDDVRWYVCHYCDYAALNAGYFAMHMLQQHNGGVSEEMLLDLPVEEQGQLL